MVDDIDLGALFKELETEEWCRAVRPCPGCKGCDQLYGNLLTRIREDLSTFARITCMYRRRCVNAIASRIREQEERKQGFTGYGEDKSNNHNQGMPDAECYEGRMPDTECGEGRVPDDERYEGRMPDAECHKKERIVSFKRPFDNLDVGTPDREQAKVSRTLSA